MRITGKELEVEKEEDDMEKQLPVPSVPAPAPVPAPVPVEVHPEGPTPVSVIRKKLQLPGEVLGREGHPTGDWERQVLCGCSQSQPGEGREYEVGEGRCEWLIWSRYPTLPRSGLLPSGST